MIEWARVNELREEVGPEDFDDVVNLFLEEVEELVERLKDMTTRHSLEEDLHFLKGSALSLGFAAFSDLCQNGERMSAAGQAEDVDVAAVINGYEQSKQEFIAQLPVKLAA